MSQPPPTARPPTGGSGFSLTNLKLMRQFYLQNTARIGQTLSGLSLTTPIGQTASDRSGAFRLSWSHCVFLLGVKSANERSFYEIEAANQSWRDAGSIDAARFDLSIRNPNSGDEVAAIEAESADVLAVMRGLAA